MLSGLPAYSSTLGLQIILAFVRIYVLYFPASMTEISESKFRFINISSKN